MQSPLVWPEPQAQAKPSPRPPAPDQPPQKPRVSARLPFPKGYCGDRQLQDFPASFERAAKRCRPCETPQEPRPAPRADLADKAAGLLRIRGQGAQPLRRAILEAPEQGAHLQGHWWRGMLLCRPAWPRFRSTRDGRRNRTPYQRVPYKVARTAKGPERGQSPLPSCRRGLVSRPRRWGRRNARF